MEVFGITIGGKKLRSPRASSIGPMVRMFFFLMLGFQARFKVGRIS